MKVLVIYTKQASALVTSSLLSMDRVEIQNLQLTETYLSDISSCSPDIILFDLIADMVCGEDYAVVRGIRTGTNVPIMAAVSASVSPFTRKDLFDAGVDGCVQVPFLPEELILRLQAMTRRDHKLRFLGTTISVRGVHVNLENHLVRDGDEVVQFTKTEYSIFLHLMFHNHAIVVPASLRAYLLQEHTASTGSIHVHILNIRRKLRRSNILHTVPRQGFLVS